MVTLQRIRDGILHYIDDEVLPKLTGSPKVFLAVYAALAADNVVGIVRQHLCDPGIAVLGLTDENGMINVEKLREIMLAKMGQEKLELQIPMIGKMTFDRTDVDKLFSYVR